VQFRTPFTSCLILTTTLPSPVLQVCQPFSPCSFLPEEYNTSLKKKRNNLKHMPSAWYLPPSQMPQQPIVGQHLLIIEALRSHSEHTTLGRTPLDKCSAQRRDLYLTTHNTHKRQISMPPAGFKPTIPESERPQTAWYLLKFRNIILRSYTWKGSLLILQYFSFMLVNSVYLRILIL
jgi:hypothetical protein